MSKAQRDMKQLQALADRVGATIRVDADRAYDLQAEAGKGTVFKANGCHTIVCSVPNASKHANALVRQDMWEQLEMGVEICMDTECDLCSETEDE